jgi:uncharacterized protein YneF (UPF0154 family)
VPNIRKYLLRIAIVGMIIIGSITIGYLEKNAAKASIQSQPPFTIQQCDEWLKQAGKNVSNTHITTLASACYQSHLVRR